MSWIKVTKRLPREFETIDGRVPILDKEGFLGYALLVDDGKNEPWLMSEFDVEYWMPVSPPESK